MTNNQIDPNKDPKELSNKELEAVAGGGGFSGVIDAAKEFGSEVKDAAQAFGEVVSEVGDTIKDHFKP